MSDLEYEQWKATRSHESRIARLLGVMDAIRDILGPTQPECLGCCHEIERVLNILNAELGSEE